VKNPGVHDTRTYFGGGTAPVLKTWFTYRVKKGGACTRVATPSLNDTVSKDCTGGLYCGITPWGFVRG
jgi:hypothetical protein